MTTPPDQLDSEMPPRPDAHGPDDQDDATLLLHPLAEAGDAEPRSGDPALANEPTLPRATNATDAADAVDRAAATEITDPALPALSPPRPPIPLTPEVSRAPTAYDTVYTRLLRTLPSVLQAHPLALLLASAGLFLALVLVLTALLAPPLVALFSGTSTTAPPVVTAGAARPLPTVTPSPTPSPSPTAATFVALDASTQGSWQGVYGSAGYVLAGDTQQLPAAIQVTPTGADGYTWAASTDDPRAPVKPENPGDRIAACWYAPTSFTIDVAITDGQTYRLALYLLDWDQQQRVETVSIVDPASGAALDTRPASAFGTGAYFVWQVRGHVTIQVTNAAGSPNAVVSALFFAPA